jgi:hypothetical protein
MEKPSGAGKCVILYSQPKNFLNFILRLNTYSKSNLGDPLNFQKRLIHGGRSDLGGSIRISMLLNKVLQSTQKIDAFPNLIQAG